MSERLFQSLILWWMRSKAAYMVSAILVFAVPFTIVFAIDFYDRGMLTLINVALLIAIAFTFGYLGALAMWNVYFKKKRL